MSDQGTGVVCTEVIELRAAPDRVRAFILTPERILDYYPAPIEGGVLEPGRAIWCRGEMGVSMLERVEAECDERVEVVKVTTAIGLEAPYTRERIEAGCTFTMVEDWVLDANGSGTTLTKSWRDIESNGPAPFPLDDTIRQSAAHETPTLKKAWDAAAG